MKRAKLNKKFVKKKNFQQFSRKKIKSACFWVKNTYFWAFYPENTPQKTHFIPEFKSQPARVRVYKYPNFDAAACLASKSFFKAEDARLYWSSSAASLVVLASTQIDKSGQSYYGSTQLHHLCARGKNSGEAAMVPLDKEGPCYKQF